MLYREVGQFKTSYNADQAVFPIKQDLMCVIGMVAIAYLAVPFLANAYWFEVILLPILVFSLAALGLNVLTGYCGQISLGTGGFMAVGAYSAFKISTAFPDMNVFVVFLISGLFAAAAGIVFGIPSLRIKGFYLAVATLASQFFFEWLFQKVGWFSNYAPSGTIGAPHREWMGVVISGPRMAPELKYLVALTFLIFFCIIVKNLTRGYLGRSMMAIRDMDIAAEIIGIRPLRTKLVAFAVSSYIIGVAGALWLFLVQGNLEADAFDILTMSFPILFMVIVGGLGTVMGSILGACFLVMTPVLIKNFPEAATSVFLVGLGAFASVHMGKLGRWRWAPVLVAAGVSAWVLTKDLPSYVAEHLVLMFFGLSIILILIYEPNGLVRLWQIVKEKLRLWPFPY